MRSDSFYSKNKMKTLRETVRYVDRENKALPFRDDNYGKNISSVKPKR